MTTSSILFSTISLGTLSYFCPQIIIFLNILNCSLHTFPLCCIFQGEISVYLRLEKLLCQYLFLFLILPTNSSPSQINLIFSERMLEQNVKNIIRHFAHIKLQINRCEVFTCANSSQHSYINTLICLARHFIGYSEFIYSDTHSFVLTAA
jgi:hypothetical protein